MIGPLGAPAAAVIGGHEQRDLVARARVPLHGGPQLGEKAVHLLRTAQVHVVAPAVRILVGFAVAHEEYLGQPPRDGHERGLMHGRVERHVGPELRVGPVERLQQRGDRVATWRRAAIPPVVHRHAAALGVDDAPKGVPGGVRHHAPVERRVAVEPLEDGGIGVGRIPVAVDTRIDEPGERLTVSRIRKAEAVPNPGHASRGAVTEELPLPGDRAPEERQQRLAPGLRRVTPEVALERRGVVHVLARAQQGAVGTAEQLLPAQAIGDDQYHVLGPGRGRQGLGGLGAGVRDATDGKHREQSAGRREQGAEAPHHRRGLRMVAAFSTRRRSSLMGSALSSTCRRSTTSLLSHTPPFFFTMSMAALCMPRLSPPAA